MCRVAQVQASPAHRKALRRKPTQGKVRLGQEYIEQRRGVLCLNKKQHDEGCKISLHYIFSDKVTPAEMNLIENQLGELLKQIIREEDQED